jgi:hypothetical protein
MANRLQVCPLANKNRIFLLYIDDFFCVCIRSLFFSFQINFPGSCCKCCTSHKKRYLFELWTVQSTSLQFWSIHDCDRRFHLQTGTENFHVKLREWNVSVSSSNIQARAIVDRETGCLTFSHFRCYKRLLSTGVFVFSLGITFPGLHG